jgi:hypothetical protein
MKLEIVKEEKLNEPTWYFCKVDGITYQCSKDLKEMEELYEKLKNNPELAKGRKTVLKSEEI